MSRVSQRRSERKKGETDKAERKRHPRFGMKAQREGPSLRHDPGDEEMWSMWRLVPVRSGERGNVKGALS